MRDDKKFWTKFFESFYVIMKLPLKLKPSLRTVRYLYSNQYIVHPLQGFKKVQYQTTRQKITPSTEVWDQEWMRCVRNHFEDTESNVLLFVWFQSVFKAPRCVSFSFVQMRFSCDQRNSNFSDEFNCEGVRRLRWRRYRIWEYLSYDLAHLNPSLSRGRGRGRMRPCKL